MRKMSHTVGAARLASRKNLDTAAEQALIDRSRRRDLDAFAKIVDAYQARIFGFVKRMIRNDEEAQDVTQEVFIKAFQAMHRFDGRSSLRTWLFKIAHNLCVDRVRRHDRAPSSSSLTAMSDEDETIDLPDTRWSPEDVVLNDELASVVEHAIETMSDKLRTVLLLHDKEDMAYEEIAAAVDVPVGTVKSRLFLARAHLQKHLSAYFAAGAEA